MFKPETKTMDERIDSALRMVWNAIAADWLQMDPNPSRRSVAEGMYDADRIDTYGEDPEAAETFRQLSYTEKRKRAMAIAKSYGY